MLERKRRKLILNTSIRCGGSKIENANKVKLIFTIFNLEKIKINRIRKKRFFIFVEKK